MPCCWKSKNSQFAPKFELIWTTGSVSRRFLNSPHFSLALWPRPNRSSKKASLSQVLDNFAPGPVLDGDRRILSINRASAETKFRPSPDCCYKQTGLAQIGQIGPNLSSPFLLTSSGNNNNNQNWV